MEHRRGTTLVGTWRLAAASAIDTHGAVISAPFGEAPAGLLIYSAEGTVAALISHAARRSLSADRIAAPAGERAEAFATFFAYGGRYTVEAERVIHHVEVASVENWVGTDLVRSMEFRDGRLVLRTPPTRVGGEDRITELVWERVA